MNPPADENPAPVILFAYKRVDHLRQTIDSLRLNPEAASTDLVLFSDAAKGVKDEAAVNAVRVYLDTVAGFRSVRRIDRPNNFGLARSIIGGVSEILKTHDRVIVLEDDLLLSPHFLRYMNDALACYAQCDRVASVHAYSLPTALPLPETYFLRGADCWGWATWRRSWSLFRPDGTALLAELQARGLTKHFDLDGSYPYTRMLEDQIAGRNDSWAIRWHASCYLADKLTLYPGRSLVHNIGNDASGTHSAHTDIYDQRLALEPIAVAPQLQQVSEAARDSVVRYLRSCQPRAGRGLWARLQRRLKVSA